MKKILVIGATGMLGTMVSEVLSKSNGIDLAITTRSKNDIQESLGCKSFFFDAKGNYKEQLNAIFSEFIPDYIVNCIGIIKPYCNDNNQGGVYDAIKVNSLFPRELSNYINEKRVATKIMQIATDCVFDGTTGKYTERAPHNPTDVYGKSKSLGEVISDNFLNIRSSIIGPELNNHLSLLDWFLSQETRVFGFTHHLWNGVTTLQFAQLCLDIISNEKFEELRNLNHTLHYIVNKDVTKYELLNIFNNTFNTDKEIVATSSIGVPIDRTLRSNFLNIELGSMEDAIKELSTYIEHSILFKNKF